PFRDWAAQRRPERPTRLIRPVYDLCPSLSKRSPGLVPWGRHSCLPLWRAWQTLGLPCISCSIIPHCQVLRTARNDTCFQAWFALAQMRASRVILHPRPGRRTARLATFSSSSFRSRCLPHVFDTNVGTVVEQL